MEDCRKTNIKTLDNKDTAAPARRRLGWQYLENCWDGSPQGDWIDSLERLRERNAIADWSISVRAIPMPFGGNHGNSTHTGDYTDGYIHTFGLIFCVIN